MPSRAGFRRAFDGVGFPQLGRLIVRHPLMVIVAWLALAIALFLAVPPLTEVALKRPAAFLPADAPILVTSNEMKRAFNEAASDNLAVVILSNENGLGAADEGTYRTLVDKLRADTSNVLSTQDFVHIAELRQAMTSEDKKAWNLPVNLRGVMGTGEGQAAYRNVVKLVKDTTANTSLTANVVGPAATLDDLTTIGAEDQHVIEIVTVLMVLTILIVVYRNVIAMLLPLATIGVSLVVAQQVVAALGEVGLGLGPQTLVLMTGMMLGAGTDYAVFLFSRYHEYVRAGMASDDALVAALGSIGGVVAGSAATVAITFLGLAFTTLGIFATIGPALTVTVAVGFAAAITLLPALIVLAGRRGWVKPRKDMTGRFWRRSGIHIARRPKAHLAASVVILVALAGCMALAKFNYDDRKTLPQDAPSNRGYTSMDAHFPVAGTLQQFILVQSPNADLRTPKALGDLEQMAQRVSQLPGIDLVRGITRPTGDVLEQAKTTYQAGEVGTKLGDASTQISARDSDLSKLSGGAHQLAGALGDVRGQVIGAVGSVRGLVSALSDMSVKFGGGKTLGELDKTATLVDNMHTLGDNLDTNLAQINDVYQWTAPVLFALNISPVCNADPACVASRGDLQRIVTAHDDGTFTSLADLGRQLRATQSEQPLDVAIRGLSGSLDTATAAARKLGISDPNSIQQKLNLVQQGADQLADASGQLAEGVQQLVDQTRVIGDGMDQASAFLLAMKRDAADPPMSGFYIPPEILTQAEFKKAATLFISADGHTARYLVQTALDPFSTAAMDQVQEIIKSAQSALPNTTLAGAKISMAGFSAAQNDIRNYYNGDIRFIITVTLIVVFLILVLLLRAIIAPIYLVASVILSYASAVGIGVLFFQFVLGQQLSWNVPGMAFLVLVAVGADYNLLLISRIRDESGRGIRSGVIKTVGATGGVITSAGLIFSASMFGLTFSSITNIVQVGFIIGVGLLLDTFVVRTVTVPAMAVLVGELNWWPSRRAGATSGPGKHRARGKRRAVGIAESNGEPVGEPRVGEVNDDDIEDIDEEDDAKELAAVHGR
jgi:RND superfamily putative drug exporter